MLSYFVVIHYNEFSIEYVENIEYPFLNSKLEIVFTAHHTNIFLMKVNTILSVLS